MKNSLSLNCEAASVLPLSAFTEAMPRSTTTMSAPREYPSWIGHDRVELPAEHRQRVGGGGRGGKFAVVERTPGFALAHRDRDLESVFLGEERIGVRLEAAVGDDEPAVACVLADVDAQHVVLRHERVRGFERGSAGHGLDGRGRVAFGFRQRRRRPLSPECWCSAPRRQAWFRSFLPSHSHAPRPTMPTSSSRVMMLPAAEPRA